MTQPNETSNSNNANDLSTNDLRIRKRKKLFSLLAATVLVTGGAGWAYWELIGSRYVTTDNAYTAVESAQVTPSVAGTIAEVRLKDAQAVKKGDPLVVIDPTDAKLALAQA
ncbi:MAG: biotin/lipoyl-binding protein [Propionivibrio sp.]